MTPLFAGIAWPYLGLFATAFAAATILPFSSEAAVVAAMLAGLDPAPILFWASLGNCLACLFNYGLGRLFYHPARKKLRESRYGRISLIWAKKYGMWSMFLSWAPLIGDPLTIVGGLFRLPLLPFILLVFSLRIGRYALIIWIM
ncbi:membrane protein YqaA, SNARE-associated domain [Cyclonatronum proteinivorum]|uniref:Membrane protein YqaA, SNARE-associated domain n=1 Tax=Cyclonatronum proteinivorum TaxID=1457365 RepID=A0A345UNK0_9BACT|nr:VTT domain-containing protein [Cyclonatronum proteinivorum]AXJ02052.1 membrane protein YqaA, SNARE-associated domain [Cyclonatronum proteinivorum]